MFILNQNVQNFLFRLYKCFVRFQCRYTLQYTYPYAYYMESGPRKKLVRKEWKAKLCPWQFFYFLSHTSAQVVHHSLLVLPSFLFFNFVKIVLNLCPSLVWIPTGPVGSRDRKPIVEGGAGWQLWERCCRRRGWAQRQWQRGKDAGLWEKERLYGWA